MVIQYETWKFFETLKCSTFEMVFSPTVWRWLPLMMFSRKSLSLCFLTVASLFLFSPQEVEDHVAFLITVPTALAIFFAIFILVCIESVFKKLLRVFSMVIWICLVAMGYLFMCFGGTVSAWDQVRTWHTSMNSISVPWFKPYLLCSLRLSLWKTWLRKL